MRTWKTEKSSFKWKRQIYDFVHIQERKKEWKRGGGKDHVWKHEKTQEKVILNEKDKIIVLHMREKSYLKTRKIQ